MEPNDKKEIEASVSEEKEAGIQAAKKLLDAAVKDETTQIYLDPDVKRKEQVEKVKETAEKISGNGD